MARRRSGGGGDLRGACCPLSRGGAGRALAPWSTPRLFIRDGRIDALNDKAVSRLATGLCSVCYCLCRRLYCFHRGGQLGGVLWNITADDIIAAPDQQRHPQVSLGQRDKPSGWYDSFGA